MLASREWPLEGYSSSVFGGDPQLDGGQRYWAGDAVGGEAGGGLESLDGGHGGWTQAVILVKLWACAERIEISLERFDVVVRAADLGPFRQVASCNKRLLELIEPD